MRSPPANKSERSLGVQQGDEWWPFVMWRPGKSSASQCLLPRAFFCLSDRPSEWAHNERSKVTARRWTRTTEKKTKKNPNRTVCSCGLASNIETERKDRMTLGSCLQCSFWWKESRKCKAESILHVGERTRANTSSILQFGKRKTGFLTTAVIHLLPVRMLHHIYTKCSFFYKKTPWAVNSEVYNPVGYTNKAIMAIALGETVSKTNNVFSSKQLRL